MRPRDNIDIGILQEVHIVASSRDLTTPIIYGLSRFGFAVSRVLADVMTVATATDASSSSFIAYNYVSSNRQRICVAL